MGVFPIKIEKVSEIWEFYKEDMIHPPTTDMQEKTLMIARLFVEHPRSVGESYWEHMSFALWFSRKLATAAFAALVHAVLPFCFEKTASTIIAELYQRTHNRGK